MHYFHSGASLLSLWDNSLSEKNHPIYGSEQVPPFNIFEVVSNWDNQQARAVVEKTQIFGCSADLVAEYTRKCLTFDADTWSAFYGILVAMGRHFGWSF